MNLIHRVTSLFSKESTPTNATPLTPAEPPHALRQHFAVSTRQVNGHDVYSVAPMQFAASHSEDTTHYDPHTESIEELPAKDAATRAVLYLLPGGFVKPIQPRNWDFIAYLAEAGLRVEIPLYGLIPTGDCTDAIALFGEVYTQLLEDHGPKNITIVADSAGGSVALGALIASHSAPGLFAHMQQHIQLPLAAPARIILNAPWVDMELSDPDVEKYKDKDPILDPKQLRPQGNLWAQGLAHAKVAEPGMATEHPIVSPINLQPEKWGEILGGTHVDVFCGDRDLSYPSCAALVEQMRKHGVAAQFHEQPGGIHMYHLAKSREAHAARKWIAAAALGAPGHDARE